MQVIVTYSVDFVANASESAPKKNCRKCRSHDRLLCQAPVCGDVCGLGRLGYYAGTKKQALLVEDDNNGQKLQP